VSVDTYHPTFLAIATANAILTGIEDTQPSHTAATLTGVRLGDRDSILSLAADLQHTLGEAMDLATKMFPLKAGTPAKAHTLPHHLWPKSVMHDVYAIRTRTKALRRLAALNATMPHLTMQDISDENSPHHSLWHRVTIPLTLRTATSPPIRNLEALSLADPLDSEEALADDTPSSDLPSRLAACFKAHRRTTRLLLKHVRTQRKLKYGQTLLRMFVKNPK
jgi:hypothetical protein